jgi:ABC-type multidrug transport system permease subunit
LGIAFRDRPRDLTTLAVVDGSGAANVLATLTPAAGFHVHTLSPAEAEQQLRLGKVALVVIPGPPVEYRFDPTRPDSALARRRVDDALQRAAGRADPLATRETLITEPGGRYIDFLIPGLLGMNIMSGGMWGVGYALVEMRVRKLLKRLAATPMRRSDFLAAMMASRMLLVFLEMALLLAFGWLVFGLVIRGSLLWVGVVSFLGAFAFSGLGLLAASRARKTESVSGLINLVMLPMFVFSGVFFSSDRFPDIAQPVIKLLPLTALNDALRAVILEGAGLGSQAGRVLVLVAWGALSFAVALRTFRWS